MEKKNIYESLRRADYLFLVDNLITIDKYESKFGEDYITVTINCYDDEVASNISYFIKMTCKYVVDVEFNEIPNEDGNFTLFIEIKKSDDFPKNVMDMIEKISLLCGDLKWRALFTGKIFSYSLTEENIKKFVNYNKKTERRLFSRKILESWIPKNLKNYFDLKSELIETKKSVYKIECFNNTREIKYLLLNVSSISENCLPNEELKIYMDFDGEFMVQKIGDFFLLTKPDSSDSLLISKIDEF